MSLRKLKLKTRMILILGIVALLQTGLIGVFALNYLTQALDKQIATRALHLATTIAAIPEIVTAISKRDTDTLQPLSLTLAAEAEARYVVIGDAHGIRLAHPNPENIGKSMQDDETSPVELQFPEKRGYSYTALGSLGWSMRARAPVYADNDELIGVISVGYLRDRVDAVIERYQVTLVLVIVVSFAISVIIALWFANHFKKAIFGLEPEQIGLRFEEQNATLESIREGIIATNATGVITTFNRAATTNLGLKPDTQLIGRHVSCVDIDKLMLETLESGHSQFDQEIWLHDKSMIVNCLPLEREGEILGVVASFRPKDEVDLVSRKLTRIQQYADSLRSQSHEHANKLHTIGGLIQIGAVEQALNLIGQETKAHQALIELLLNAVPDPVLAGCLLGKFNRARELGLHLAIDNDSRMAELPDHLPREELVSILGNLIDNALEATLKHSGKTGEVSLSMTDLGKELIFEIEDQGPGIPTENYHQIFEKGYSSKESHGHGFGLHLVKSQLERLNGSITLEPGELGGSRFTVYIPKTAETSELKHG
ncbi:MAG: sensor histidine kinase [Pseudomonadota bacterium]